MAKAGLILGDQLFSTKDRLIFKDMPIFMSEDRGLCTHFNYHKAKIIFFLTSMRTFAQELKETNYQVNYHYLTDSELSFVERLKLFCVEFNVNELHFY